MVIDLEKLTLSYIVLNESTDLLCSLTDGLFTGKHLNVYNIIEQYYCQFSKIISLDELRIKAPDSGIDEWTKLYKDFYVEPELLKQELESTRARTFLVDSMLDLADNIHDKDPTELTEDLSNIQMNISDMDTDKDSLLEDAVETEVTTEKEEMYTSGLCATFDEFFGGLALQSISGISGIRGSGKSIILQNLANYHYLTHKNTVLFANIEMSKLSVRQRMLSMISSVPYSDIRRGLSDIQKITVEKSKARFFYKNDYSLQDALIAFEDEGIEAGKKALGNCNKKDEKLLFLDDAGLTVSKLSYYIKAIKKKHDLKLVCIDYLQIVKDSSKEKGVPDWLAQTLIAVQLKEIAKRENIIILTALQIHTDGGTKRALAIEDSLDLSLKFFPEIDPKTGEKTNVIKFYMAKTRDSESRNFFADIDWNTLTLNYNANQAVEFEDQERKDISKA